MALQEAVRSVDGIDSLLALLRDELAWPVEPAAAQEDYTFTWNAQELRLDECATRRLCHGFVRQLRPFTAGQPWGIFLVEFMDGHIYRSSLRQVLRGLVPNRRRAAGLPAWQHENLLFVCTTRDYDRFTFAHFRGERAQKARLATFGWERGDEYIHTLCEYNLPALRFPQDEGKDAQAWLSSWAKAFDKEPLTRRFFKCFENALEAVKADLEKHQRLPSAQAYSRAQLLLERLIFCYFLQKRGWLAQDPDFLIKHFEPFSGRPGEFTYYQDFLERLFWSLATPPRSDAFRFADVPFLNGGLFDDDEFAPKEFAPKRMKQDPPLKIRNATFEEAVFRNLLEAFNFTVCEDTPLNQDVAVDPEMLGKVFESIVLHAEAADPDAVAPDKRKATGSYYTPRIVVHFICRETLLQWLKTQLGDDWTPRLKALFDLDPTDGLQADELAHLKTILSPKEGARLAGLLKGLKCCDPAVGSGAFPVGLLHELANLRRVCEAAANGYVDPGRSREWLHEAKADIVENCLYGVDIQQQAIEICRLRLWLSLVVDDDLGLDPFQAERSQFRAAIGRISQLPNLEMNFHRGDSLHDHISGVPVLVEGLGMRPYQKELDAIRKLGRDLHRATKGERKRKLRVETLARRLDLTERVLTDELKKMQAQDADLAAAWFGETVSDAEKRRRLAHEIAQVQAALKTVQGDRKELEKLAPRIYDADFFAKLRRLEGADFDSPFNFAWPLDLPAIYGREPAGFDIIVGNPPFVTARNPRKRELYRERWRRVCYQKYLLVCPFFELSFGLLRPRGQLGFIVSNAFAKREFGRPLVEKFFPTVDLQKVVDCSGLMFPGHGTPTCIVFGRNQPPAPDSTIRVAAILPGGGDLRTPPEESPLWQSLEAHHDQQGFLSAQVIVADQTRREMHSHPWNFDAASGPTKHLLETSCSRILRHHLDDDIGVCTMTNCDDVFVLFADEARRLVGATADIRVFQEGDTQRNWSVKPDQFAVCPYGKDNQVLQPGELHAATLRYLKHYKGPLEERLSFGNKTFRELGRHWYEYERMNRTKYAHEAIMSWSFVSTHMHAIPVPTNRLFKQSNVVATTSTSRPQGSFLLCAVLNCSAALFWLKQECYNKGAGEDEHRDRFEFAGTKVQGLPIPAQVDEGLREQGNSVVERLALVAKNSWDRGRQIPALGMVELLEKEGEAYHAWNSALPGHIPPHPDCSTSATLAQG